MRCCECQSIIIGDYYRHMTKRIGVCSDHSCQIEHAKEHVTGKDLTEFIKDGLTHVSRELLLDIALNYIADSEQEFCEWFFSDVYVKGYALEADAYADDEDARSWRDYDRERD